MRVVLCHSNHSDPHAQFIINHLRSNGYGVDLPDCSQDFDDKFVSNRTGFSYNFWGRRLFRYREALRQMPDDAVVMLLDVRDVLIMGTAEEALGRFQAFGVPLVSSCTEVMWPPPADCPAYVRLTSPFNLSTSCQFPCAGAFMGFRSAIWDLIKEDTFNEATNDQCWLHEQLLRRSAGKDWTLDTNGRLFLDYNRLPLASLVPRGGRFEVTGWTTPPTVIHLAGLHPTTEAVRQLYSLAAASALAETTMPGRVQAVTPATNGQ